MLQGLASFAIGFAVAFLAYRKGYKDGSRYYLERLGELDE